MIQLNVLNGEIGACEFSDSDVKSIAGDGGGGEDEGCLGEDGVE